MNDVVVVGNFVVVAVVIAVLVFERLGGDGRGVDGVGGIVLMAEELFLTLALLTLALLTLLLLAMTFGG